MQQHVHTSFVDVLFAGVSAIIVINLLRLVAAKMVETEQTRAAGKALGALVK